MKKYLVIEMRSSRVVALILLIACIGGLFYYEGWLIGLIVTVIFCCLFNLLGNVQNSIAAIKNNFSLIEANQKAIKDLQASRDQINQVQSTHKASIEELQTIARSNVVPFKGKIH